jgi:hypothetical protein
VLRPRHRLGAIGADPWSDYERHFQMKMPTSKRAELGSLLIWRRDIKAFILVLTASWYLVWTSAWAATADLYLDGKMKVIDDDIGSWIRTGQIIAWLTFAIAAIGIIVAAFQVAKNKWIKILAAVLSVVSALIIAFNHIFFTADYRAYQKMAKAARSKLEAFRDELDGFPNLDQATTHDLHMKFSKLKSDIDELEQRTIYNATVVANRIVASPDLGEILLSTARADEKTSSVRPPAWVTKLPSDEHNLYFVGIAEGDTLDDARKNALLKAESVVAEAFDEATKRSGKLTGRVEFVADLTKSLAGASEVAATFAGPSPTGVGYRAFTLLRLSKSVAAVNAETAFVENGVPYDKAFLDSLNGGSAVLANTSVQATNEQRQAVNNGVVYIQFTNESNRPLAEALRQSLSSIANAPSIQLQPDNQEDVVRYFHKEDADLASKVKQAAEIFLDQEGYRTTLRLDDLSETAVTGKNKQVEVWLAQKPMGKPRVNLKVQTGTSPGRVEGLKKALVEAGYEVSKIESVDVIPSHDARVIYYKKSDAEKANSLVKALPELGVTSFRETATEIKERPGGRPNQYDLNVGKDTLGTEPSP